ncbi:SpoIIE family protein phosphatase, partial [Streptomyces clavuligerus]
SGERGGSPAATAPTPTGALQDRLVGWVTDLAALHDLTERMVRTRSVESALQELLHAGAALMGARRGLVVLEPPADLPRAGRPGRATEDRGPSVTRGLGLTHAELGSIETIPRTATAYGRILEGREGTESTESAEGSEGPEGAGAPDGTDGAGRAAVTADGSEAREDSEAPEDQDQGRDHGHGEDHGRAQERERGQERDRDRSGHFGDLSLDPRGREVAARLGCAAAYTQPLTARTTDTLGAAVWLYDDPGAPAPGERRRRIGSLYAGYAAEHLARLLEVERARETVAAVAEELLPSRLPRVPGVSLAARHRTGARGGGDWYDAIPLPEGALGLAVGSVGGSGPGTPAVMGRLRASLRAYAVMEGEDPVAVLSDLELLLRMTEPSRTATALFAHAEPTAGRMVLAGAGHTPPLVIGERRTEFVETSLSAPLGMLTCWEAPSVELSPAPGETVLLYTDGLLRRTGDSMDRAFARLHTAAASVPKAALASPGAIADHILHMMFPPGAPGGAGTAGGPGAPGSDEDIVLLAARFG